MRTKLVIYKSFGSYKCTTFSNYFGMIRNERLVQDCSAFDSAAEIIEYYCKWFGSKEEDFEIMD